MHFLYLYFAYILREKLYIIEFSFQTKNPKTKLCNIVGRRADL